MTSSLQRLVNGNNFNFIDGTAFFFVGDASGNGLLYHDFAEFGAAFGRAHIRRRHGLGPRRNPAALHRAAEQSAGDNIITGFFEDDDLEMGPGNDLLLGGDGSDTYTYRPGDGIDRINDSGNGSNGHVDEIVFADWQFPIRSSS